MLELGKNSAPDPVKNGSEATFVKDVIEGSQRAPVIAYFSAAWCGPCKTFGPELESAVRRAAGAVTLVKLDLDSCQQIAAQMGIQSIPAVFAFVGGRPVDGFMGARTASEINAFIGKLAKSGAGSDNEAAVREAEELLASGAAVEAAQRFAAVLSEFPEHAASLAGLARAHLALGNIESAEGIVNSAPASIAGAREVAAAKAAVELAKQAANTGPLGELRSRVQANPEDHQSRLDLATALHAQGQDEEAIDELLQLFRRDREWQDGAARLQLLRIFESLKPNDPVALKGRRRLASLVFD